MRESATGSQSLAPEGAQACLKVGLPVRSAMQDVYQLATGTARNLHPDRILESNAAPGSHGWCCGLVVAQLLLAGPGNLIECGHRVRPETCRRELVAIKG